MTQVDFHLPNIAFVKPDGRLTRESFIFMRQLWNRTGGASDLIDDNTRSHDTFTFAASIALMESAIKRVDEMETIVTQQRAQIQKMKHQISNLESEVETWPVS